MAASCPPSCNSLTHAPSHFVPLPSAMVARKASRVGFRRLFYVLAAFALLLLTTAVVVDGARAAVGKRRAPTCTYAMQLVKVLFLFSP